VRRVRGGWARREWEKKRGGAVSERGKVERDLDTFCRVCSSRNVGVANLSWRTVAFRFHLPGWNTVITPQAARRKSRWTSANRVFNFDFDEILRSTFLPFSLPPSLPSAFPPQSSYTRCRTLSAPLYSQIDQNNRKLPTKMLSSSLISLTSLLTSHSLSRCLQYSWSA